MMKKINLDSSNKKVYDQKFLEYLAQYVTDNKKDLFEVILSKRTKNLTIVLEDIFKAHNASAVLRTAECMGIQDVHVVEQRNPYDYNPYVLRGSGKWLSLHKYDQTSQNMKVCFDRLKSEGYQMIATSPHEYAVDYADLELTEKTAVIFGTEETGISEYVKENADGFVKIPMMGFTESFNISVSAAIVLEDFNRKIRKKFPFQLSEDEKSTLRLEWYKKVVSRIDIHTREFEKSIRDDRI